MARTLSSRQTELTGRAARAPIPLVVLTTYTDRSTSTVDTTYYLSDRGVIYDFGNAGTDRHFIPALVGFDGPIQAAMQHIPPDRGGAAPSGRGGQITFSQAALELGGNAFLADLRGKNIEFSTLVIAELDVDYAAREGSGTYDLRSLTGDEHVVWGRFEVSRVVRADAETFTLELRVPEPEIPWTILTDATNNDPEDLGKRHNILYGSVKRVRCLGITAPARTTLAQAITASTTGNVKVTSSTGLGSVAQIGGERVAVTVVDGTTVNITARAQSSTVAADHPAGTAVVEILNGAKWAFSGHVSKAIDAVYCFNPYNGELFTLTATTHYSTTLNDSGLSTISMTDTQMKALYDAMARSAAVTTQPVVSHDVDSSATQLPSSGDSNIIDGNVSTHLTIPTSGGANSGTVSFTRLGVVVEQVIWFYRGAGDQITLYRGAYGAGGASIASVSPSADGWYAITTALDYDDFNFGNTGTVSFDLHDVYRDVRYQAADPSLSTNAAIAGGDIGYPLDLYADGQGYAAPDSTYYSVSSGTLLEHPSDILRHLIAVVCGKGHGSIDDTTFDAWVTNFSGLKHACNLVDLGDNFSDCAGRIAFEGIANLITSEGASATVWKALVPSHDAGNKVFEWSTAGAVTLTDLNWSAAEEQTRDLDTYFTRFRILYDRDPSIGFGEDAYRKVLRADKDQNDLSTYVATTDFENAEKRYGGRRDHPGFGCLCIADDTTAKIFGAYMAQEHMRIARELALDGLPWWDAYDREIGDLVAAQPSWDTSSRYYRVIEHQHGLADSGLSILAVEVRT